MGRCAARGSNPFILYQVFNVIFSHWLKVSFAKLFYTVTVTESSNEKHTYYFYNERLDISLDTLNTKAHAERYLEYKTKILCLFDALIHQIQSMNYLNIQLRYSFI